MLAVIDYGGGNMGSLISGLQRRDIAFSLTSDPDHVASADAAILPGDGAFGATMDALRARGLDAACRALIDAGRPFFGICVGMQLLFEGSDEYGVHDGLGVLRGTIERFKDAPRIPHMGWNDLEIVRAHPFVDGVKGGDYAYFLHSYRAAVGEDTVAACTHGERFAAIVARGNVVATQFHPEKSQRTGARLLDNFVRMMQSTPASA